MTKRKTTPHLKAGAPELYRREFHPEEFMRLSKQGKNITQIAAKWDLSRQALYDWTERHPEFLDAVTTGKSLCEAWYTDVGQRAMFGKMIIDGKETKVDYNFFMWMSKNVCKWSDKVEHIDKTPVSKKQLTVNVNSIKNIIKKIEDEC